MGYKQIVTCDLCGIDITNSTGSDRYRIVVHTEKLPYVISGKDEVRVVHSVYVIPPLDRIYYFCGTTCLTTWAKELK